MRKKYYVEYYKDFANTYSVYWSETEINDDRLQRITRKRAIELCVEERQRRKNDPAFSGFASTAIEPYFYNGNIYDCQLNGYILENRSLVRNQKGDE